jgi:hypothetical protein
LLFFVFFFSFRHDVDCGDGVCFYSLLSYAVHPVTNILLVTYVVL